MRSRASTFLLSTFRGKDNEEPRRQNSKDITTEGHEEPGPEKFVIALLGPSGVGKSSFIAHATGQNVKIGHLLSSCTDTIDIFEKRRSDGKVIVFVDTPGYDLADKNPNRVLNLLTQWLKSQSANGVRVNLNAILFFHRITDNRMPVATQSHINRFEKLVGKRGAPKRILLITTMWDEVEHPGKGRLRGLRTVGGEAAGAGSTLGGEKKNGEASFPPGEDGSGSLEDPRMGFAVRARDNSGREKAIPVAEKRDADVGAVVGRLRVSDPGNSKLLPLGWP